MNRVLYGILSILDRAQRPMGSIQIKRELPSFGLELSERTIRYHLKILDERGWTKNLGKSGRIITEKGKEELQATFVSERVGFVITKIETFSFLTNFDIESMKGRVILNVSFFPEKRYREVLGHLHRVFRSPFVMSDRVIFEEGGGKIGEIYVPKGYFGLGTICSITINGILLKKGIPVASKFGGIVEVEKGVPLRFLSLISYEGTTLDPLEVFIKSKMTNVRGALRGRGKILGSLREIPSVAMGEVKELKEQLKKKGIGGILEIGKPSQPLLGVPINVDRVGMLVLGGLNPAAYLEEVGIPTENIAMATVFEYSELRKIEEYLKEGK